MRQTAFVAEIHGNQAVVVSERASSCGSCAGKASCSTLGSWREGSGNGRILSLRVDNMAGAKLDDEVVIEVADDLVMKTAFRLYAMPMVAFVIVGGLVWQGLAMLGSDATDVGASIAGILAVMTYYAWIWKQGTPDGFVAKIIEVKRY